MNHTAEDSLPNELSKVDDAQQHKSGEPNFDAKLSRRAASAARVNDFETGAHGI
jgi:hypothetical protein